MTEQTQSKCSICKKNVAPQCDNKNFPFCCERCQQIDLGRWFDETYSIASVREESDGEPWSLHNQDD